MSEISFRDTLESFQAFILQHDKTLKKVIVGSDDEFLETRMDIYYQGYSLRLLETMTRTFPVVQKLAGEELFEKLAREYISYYPSNHFSIRFFGRHFSNFLSTHAQAQPVWVEMAAFEWMLGKVIDEPDAPHLRFEDLTALSPEAWSELKLAIHPSLQNLPLYYPIPALWQAVQQNADYPVLERLETPLVWLIWRYELRAHFCSVSAEQLTMINALQSGQTFSEVCAGLCEFLEEDQVVNFAAQTLRQWISEGIFSGFIVSKQS